MDVVRNVRRLTCWGEVQGECVGWSGGMYHFIRAHPKNLWLRAINNVKVKLRHSAVWTSAVVSRIFMQHYCTAALPCIATLSVWGMLCNGDVAVQCYGMRMHDCKIVELIVTLAVFVEELQGRCVTSSAYDAFGCHILLLSSDGVVMSAYAHGVLLDADSQQ